MVAECKGNGKYYFHTILSSLIDLLLLLLEQESCAAELTTAAQAGMMLNRDEQSLLKDPCSRILVLSCEY